MVERIIDRSAQLELAPNSGARLPVFVDEEMRELLERPYRIVYRITDTAVEILTVKHYRQRLVDRPQDF
jgi:toxin ParE1/3/4